MTLPTPDNADPFTKVERALWAVLEADTEFCALVARANRVNFANPACPTDPVRESLSTADMPEVMILPTTAAPNTHRTSAGPSLRQDYNLIITSGDARTHAKLNPVKWAVWKAFERLMDDMTTRCPFVRKVDTGNFNDGFNNPAPGTVNDRGPRGWGSVLEIQVLMFFEKAVLGT